VVQKVVGGGRSLRQWSLLQSINRHCIPLIHTTFYS
jgi:hypothetical protein